MTARPLTLPLILLACLWSGSGVAQRASPEDVAREHFAALQSKGMRAVVEYMHPDALAEFKTMVMPIFEEEEKAGQRGLRGVTFDATITIEEIRALAPDVFMNGFMNLVLARTEDVSLSFDQIEIVGVVPEGEQRHVLARITIGANELSITQFEVLSFVPFQDTWRMKLTGELQGLASALRQQLGR
jgi:hypothetical protein